LFTPRQIDSSYVQQVPEAHYQQELYRCCGVSSTHIFPEFGTRTGRVDFYIPSKKWAIELLREGDNINGHCKRFSDGHYNHSVPVVDHLVLDCRQVEPRHGHPGR
ncbi:hypothetical protein CPB86DRAFT_716433, partial [Serendipita vermifera]